MNAIERFLNNVFTFIGVICVIAFGGNIMISTFKQALRYSFSEFMIWEILGLVMIFLACLMLKYGIERKNK